MCSYELQLHTTSSEKILFWMTATDLNPTPMNFSTFLQFVIKWDNFKVLRSLLSFTYLPHCPSKPCLHIERTSWVMSFWSSQYNTITCIYGLRTFPYHDNHRWHNACTHKTQTHMQMLSYSHLSKGVNLSTYRIHPEEYILVQRIKKQWW